MQPAVGSQISPPAVSQTSPQPVQLLAVPKATHTPLHSFGFVLGQMQEPPEQILPLLPAVQSTQPVPQNSLLVFSTQISPLGHIVAGLQMQPAVGSQISPPAVSQTSPQPVQLLAVPSTTHVSVLAQ
jgi:hypothetical protein